MSVHAPPKRQVVERVDSLASDDSLGDGNASESQLAGMESKLNKRLALLERLKEVDVHTACWEGDLPLVQAHLDFAAAAGSFKAKRELRAASRQLRALEKEAETMSRKRESLANDGDADECEIAVAYDEKLGDARDTVAAARRVFDSATESAAREAANLEDTSEFGEGYRPLHYAAYAGHAAVVDALLEAGARLDEKNAAGCTPLFLACQQGRAEVVQLIYAKDPATNCASKHELVPTGDGRRVCCLDVSRAADCRVAGRAETRAILLKSLAGLPNARTPPPPTLRPCDADDAGRVDG